MKIKRSGQTTAYRGPAPDLGFAVRAGRGTLSVLMFSHVGSCLAFDRVAGIKRRTNRLSAYHASTNPVVVGICRRRKLSAKCGIITVAAFGRQFSVGSYCVQG